MASAYACMTWGYQNWVKFVNIRGLKTLYQLKEVIRLHFSIDSAGDYSGHEGKPHLLRHFSCSQTISSSHPLHTIYSIVFDATEQRLGFELFIFILLCSMLICDNISGDKRMHTKFSLTRNKLEYLWYNYVHKPVYHDRVSGTTESGADGHRLSNFN